METATPPKPALMASVPFHLIPVIALGIWSADLSSSGVMVDPEWIRPQADIEELPPEIPFPLQSNATISL